MASLTFLRSWSQRITRGWWKHWVKPKRPPRQRNRTVRFECLDARLAMAADAAGESAPDLVAFAKALSEAGVIYFGTDWDASTSQQERLFGDGADYLEFYEVTNPDRTLNELGERFNITIAPTWRLQDLTYLTGVQTIEQLATATGVSIPMSSVPSMKAIEPQIVLRGSPLHVPINAYDPNGNPLTISVTSSQPSVVKAEVLTGNQSARIRTETFGDMVFELFNAEAPVPVSRFSTLAQSGFYNSTASSPMTFHRVAPGFVIQGGDPLGNGKGGSTLGLFNDQYNVNLQHNRSGVLSYAKSDDDTNDSQFFITGAATRGLDFNHSIFGQMIEGERTRLGIERTPVGGTTGDRPTFPVNIQSIEIFEDHENGLIRLTALGAADSTAEITVTVSDTQGNNVSQTFTVTVMNDPFDTAPFLVDFPTIESTVNQPIDIILRSVDVEGDPVRYQVAFVPGENVPFTAATFNANTGEVHLELPPGYVGNFGLMAAVSQNTPSAPPGFDSQMFRFQVRAPLELSFTQSTMLERDGRLTGRVTRLLADASQPLVVSLQSSAVNQATVPTTVTIPANARFVDFEVIAVDDEIIDGVQGVTITAEASHFFSAAVGVHVIDDESVSQWHNPSRPFDVNGDQVVSLVDVLIIINSLKRIGTGVLPPRTEVVAPFLDVNGDHQLSLVDVLVVINALRRGANGSGGEGEASQTAPQSTLRDSALSLWLSEEESLLKKRGGGGLTTSKR